MQSTYENMSEENVAKHSKYILITRMCWSPTHTILGNTDIVKNL